VSDADYEREPLRLATGDAHRVKLPPRVLRGRLTGFLFETNKAATAAARSFDSVRLLGSGPTVSVWPVTSTFRPGWAA
jgi:hypothetical protein